MNHWPDSDFSPIADFRRMEVARTGVVELLNENIARIESLKIHILDNQHLTPAEKRAIFGELDVLRGAFVEVASRHVRPEAGLANISLDGHHEQNELVLEGILGQSKKISNILKVISRVAPTDLSVLLEGETGSGKELFARIIHLNSKRRKFVAVNCGAFPSSLIESELFGHIKGAFTGAVDERKGKFEDAHGGTIFLDEIGDLELIAQVKLLRVLEQGELQRVGSEATIRVDVRVIAATNRNLEEMVRLGSFREDLLYRINVCPLTIPPLRERRDEIEILLDLFLEEISASRQRLKPRLGPEVRDFLLNEYHYPGNIRELKNIARYLAAMADGGVVTMDDLPERYRTAQNRPPEEGDDPSWPKARHDAERVFLLEILAKHGGNVEKVQEEMRLSKARVYQLLKRYKLRPRDFRQ